MRYKIVLSNTKESITIRENELKKVLRGIQEGNPVMVLEGIFNPSYFVAIVPDYDRAKTVEQGFQEPSPFAASLSGKMSMLSAPERTKAQEESAKEERKS